MLKYYGKELLKKVSNPIMRLVSSYVDQNEWRVLNANIVQSSIYATVKCFSPSYTGKQVEYLSTSEIAISTAQVAHILVEDIVSSEDFKFKDVLTTDRLHLMRLNHNLFFTNWRVKFYKKHPLNIYELIINNDRILCKNKTIFGKFTFYVEKFLQGEFLAVIPGHIDKFLE